MGKKLKVAGIVILALMGISAFSGGSDSESADTTFSSSVTSHKVVKKSSSSSSSKKSSSSATSTEKSSSVASSTSKSEASDATKGLAKADDHGLTGAVQQPLAYATSRQMVMQPLDHLRRAVELIVTFNCQTMKSQQRSVRQDCHTIQPVGTITRCIMGMVQRVLG